MSTIITGLQTIPQSTVEQQQFRGSALAPDAAWAPQVPLSHTNYTWTGHMAPPQPHNVDASHLLGCLRKEETTAQ